MQMVQRTGSLRIELGGGREEREIVKKAKTEVTRVCVLVDGEIN